LPFPQRQLYPDDRREGKMIQDTLFTGRQLAAAGMKKVFDKELAAWKNLAFDAAFKLAYSRADFTIEDVIAKVGKPPRHPNSAGALLGSMEKMGYIEWTGCVVRSKTPSRHSALIRVWRANRKNTL
jgi:hypothetical protein